VNYEYITPHTPKLLAVGRYSANSDAWGFTDHQGGMKHTNMAAGDLMDAFDGLGSSSKCWLLGVCCLAAGSCFVDSHIQLQLRFLGGLFMWAVDAVEGDCGPTDVVHLSWNRWLHRP